MLGFFRRGEPDPSTPSSPGIARRARSAALLKSKRVPINKHLPPLEDESESTAHAVDEIFRRMRANLVYFMRGQFAMDDVPYAEYRSRMDTLGAWGDLSPKERAVVDAEALTQRQILDTSWALESVNALAWSIGLVGDLPWPGAMCNADEVIGAIRRTATAAELTVRPLGALLDQADLHYCLLWACRQAVTVERRDPPRGVEPSVVMERRRALDWLVHRGLEWDEADLSS